MAKRRKSLPPIPRDLPSSLRPLYAAMVEIIETGEGVRGDKLDQKLTFRDVIDGGLADLRVPGNPSGGFVPTNPVPELDMTPPPPPTGFAVNGSFFGSIVLTWDLLEGRYANLYAYTNIYRSAGGKPEDDNFANASIIGRTMDRIYTDRVRTDTEAVGDDPTILPGYYYWITHVSKAGIEGPVSSPNGAFARPLPDAELLLAQLSGRLEETHLAQHMRERLDTFEANDSDFQTQISELRSLVENDDGSWAQQIQQVIADYQAADQQTTALIQSEATARADAISAMAESVDTVASRVGDNEAIIQTQAQAIDGLRGQWSVKIDANGYVSGIGLNNTGKTSEFAIHADNFWISSPGAQEIKPFMVVGDKTYINSAYIQEASIQQGQLGPINFGKIVDEYGNPVTTVTGQLRADKVDISSLTVGNAQIVGDIWSTATNPQNGRALWKLHRNGTFEQTSSSPSGGWKEETGDYTKVYDGNGQIRVHIGNLNL